ncbi:MAG: fumarylacetoacetate hydrolase family protein [Clostridium sp.]|uniref:fumarylacetoacetate hydrolase family protein n=1 Tax=Clostridium sp. TaxID=1506 RepID=UPI0039E8D392
MKFVTFLVDNEKKLGMFNRDMTKVVNINNLNLYRTYNDMMDLIKNSSRHDLKLLKKVYDEEGCIRENGYSTDDIKICTPIETLESDILCLGLNYREHVEETARSFKDDSIDIPEYPVYFSKRAVSPIGPEDSIDSHGEVTEQLDYEVELAVIIGKDGINIAKEDAEEYIFGYTIMNDASARDVQQRHVQWYRGKSLDTFTSLGPCIVHKSELKFPIELDLSSKVNGELRQNSNTKNFIFDIPTIIHDISQGMTLRAGDIIATGTPSGVGMGFKPPRFLQKGDVVQCEVENIGVLENKIV